MTKTNKAVEPAKRTPSTRGAKRSASLRVSSVHPSAVALSVASTLASAPEQATGARKPVQQAVPQRVAAVSNDAVANASFSRKPAAVKVIATAAATAFDTAAAAAFEADAAVPRQPAVPGDAWSDTESPAQRDPVQVYLQEIGKTPLLKPDEEVVLARRIQAGDAAARERMIRSNLRLVVKIAHDYTNFGLPLSDLISEGNIGLIKAVERFDPDKGGKLSTYAAWWIKQSIKRALANQSKTIRLPVHLVEKISRIRKATHQLQDELRREPTHDEIASVVGMTPGKVAHLKGVSVRPASLDAPIGEGEETTRFGDIISDESASSPYEDVSGRALLGDIRDVIDRLDKREAEIIRMRFGLEGRTPMTLEEVGEAFGVTRERVRQLQNMALMKLRRMMADKERQRSVDEVREERIEAGRNAVLREFFAKKTPAATSR